METFVITKPSDAIPARERVREIARSLGFGLVDQTNLAFAVSEFALKLIAVADHCRLHIDLFRHEEGRTGIEVKLCEQHTEPFVVDADWAIQLVDDLVVYCEDMYHTKITIRKWPSDMNASNDSFIPVLSRKQGRNNHASGT